MYYFFDKYKKRKKYLEESKLKSPFKYFSFAEFDSPDEEGSGEKYMNENFIKRLDRARERAGIPFKINSGYRTEKQNKKVGGVSDSAHKKGLAADIAAKTENDKKIIAKALYQENFIRLGFGKNFIHVDIDDTKPQVQYAYEDSKIYRLNDLV